MFVADEMRGMLGGVGGLLSPTASRHGLAAVHPFTTPRPLYHLCVISAHGPDMTAMWRF